MTRIPVTDSIAIDSDEIEERFVRSSGAGGQNVNKVSSACELRFDVRNSPSLPDDVRHRLYRLAGSRLTSDGVIVIFAQRFRDQPLNRQDALDRLVELIAKATERPKPRRKTKPTKASKTRRLEGKAKRSGVKAARARPAFD
jgi:ribosome-associated protein